MREIKSTTITHEIWRVEKFIQLCDAFGFAYKSSVSSDFDDPSSMPENNYINLIGLNSGNDYFMEFFERIRNY